jgi:hypothetical protein
LRERLFSLKSAQARFEIHYARVFVKRSAVSIHDEKLNTDKLPQRWLYSVYQNILISKHSRATGKYIPKNLITVQSDIALRIKKADHPDSAFCNFNMF